MTLAKSAQVAQDYKQALSFPTALGGNSIFDYRAIHDTDRARPAIPFRGTLNECWKSIIRYNNQGYGIFSSIAILDGAGRELPNVTAIRAHYVDLDNISARQNMERAASSCPPPQFAVQSSPERFHVYWVVQPYSGNDRFTVRQTKLAHIFDGDRSIIDAARVMRLPGSLNLKNPASPHLVTCWGLAGNGRTTPIHELDAALAHIPVISGGAGGRHELGDPSLAAPSIEWLLRALEMIDPNTLSRAEWIAVTAATKQAGWTLTTPDYLCVIWSAWCARYTEGNGNDIAENHKNWQSIRNSEVGWPYLLRRVPQLIAEQYAPVASVAPVSGQVVLSPIDMPMDVTTGAPSVLTIVQALREWNAPFAFDQFAGSAVLTGPLQRAVNQSYPRPVEDADATAIAILFNAMARKPATATIHEAINYYARLRPYNPVTDYLNSLQWDGLPRLDNWLAIYCGAAQSEWTALIGRKVLIAMVARAMQPGCKVDTVLILEGLQGIGKSTAFEVLAGSDHFTDDLDGMQEKDDKMALMGRWVVEIGELSAMRRNEVDQVKRFIARKDDKFRLPFARNVSSNPRTCIFIGTTNSDEYLKDETGNRRFWPVRCNRIDLDGLRRDRDMLLAEAVHRYRSGERWWLDGAENDLAAIEQDARTEAHDWEAIIADHIAARHGVPFTTEDVIGWVGYGKASLNDPKVTRPIKRIMTRLGYKKSRPRRDNPGYQEIYVLIGL